MRGGIGRVSGRRGQHCLQGVCGVPVWQSRRLRGCERGLLCRLHARSVYECEQRRLRRLSERVLPVSEQSADLCCMRGLFCRISQLVRQLFRGVLRGLRSGEVCEGRGVCDLSCELLPARYEWCIVYCMRQLSCWISEGLWELDRRLLRRLHAREVCERRTGGMCELSWGLLSVGHESGGVRGV